MRVRCRVNQSDTLPLITRCEKLGGNITLVSTSPDQMVLQHLAPLCAPLHDAFSKAAEITADLRKRAGLTSANRDYVGAHLIRSIAHEQLISRQQELGGWVPGRVEPNNGSLKLYAHKAKMRILHSPGFGKFPAPGRNLSRQRYYRQSTINGLEVDDMLPQLEESKYIATWSVLDPKTYDVGIQVFRPIGIFKHGSPCKADLAFWLPNDEDELAKLTFEPSDDDIDVMLPGDEEEDGGVALRG